ncbi:hypothetical protein RDWZM_008795 [Blomia tropicalis]|uniref:AMP-dependent synthetase/ligase domain-containing protein n=1 Tax=Blomia tropicalis TaxID=40697 RepID=A0A9Q0M046_BLOTA|nr:hypothetical protein RDWZM_008795 [Blomia tropicalis]
MCKTKLCFRGPPRFIGYLDNLEATNDAIDSDGWYHTGDVGYYDERGHIFICDRIKELLSFRIWSVYSTEIESFINSHPAVRLACVVGVRHATDGMYVRAYVELVDNKQTVIEQEIIKYVEGKFHLISKYGSIVAENMAFHKRLHGGVRFVEKMPRTRVGYSLTYGQLDEKCNELGSALVKLNINQQDVIAFFADNSIEYAIFMITAMYLGVTFVPIAPADGPFELSYKFKLCKVKFLVHGLNKIKKLEKLIENSLYLEAIKQLKIIVQLNVIEPHPLLIDGKPITAKIWSSAQLFAMGKGQTLSQIPHFPIEDLATSKFFICFTSGTTLSEIKCKSRTFRY